MSIAQRNSPPPTDDRTEAPEGLVVGRYVVFPAIAMGGMASVHIGRMSGPVGFSRTVAVKRLHPQFAGDPEFVSMFLDEARLAARVQHPNVVSVLDVVALDGELFLIMDFVRGESLSRLLQGCRENSTTPPIDCVVAILAGILHGLHAAHEARDERGEPLGMVHRDVSPQNVLVGADGVSRLVDFGVARATDRVQCTREGQIKGKLDYLAPEQLECTPATRKTDIYAASIVLWEALAGRRLFQSEEVGGKVTRTLLGGFPPPSCVNPKVSSALDAVVMKGMARRPEDRFDTARDMAVALERAAPAASASRVGDWVMVLASDRLFERDRMITRIEALSDSAVRRRSSLLHEVARSRAAVAAEPTLESVGVPALQAAASESPDIEVSCVVARTSLIDLDQINSRAERPTRVAPSSGSMTRLQKAAIGIAAIAFLSFGVSLGRAIARAKVHGQAHAVASASQLARSAPALAPAQTTPPVPAAPPTTKAAAEPAIASSANVPRIVTKNQPAPPRETATPKAPPIPAAPATGRRSTDDFSKLTRR